MDMDGKNQARLTPDSQNYYYPQFSPDGSNIMFYSKNEGNDEIYIMDIDGIIQKNLTKTEGNDNLCQFSPDGSKILFYDSEIFNKYKIYIMDADGKNKIKLTNSSFYYNDLFPHFQP